MVKFHDSGFSAWARKIFSLTFEINEIAAEQIVEITDTLYVIMKKSAKKNLQSSGVFTMPDGRQVFGNLHLKGRSTFLHLQPKDKLALLGERSVIHGELGDLRKVSCLECIVGSTGSGYYSDAGRYHYADIFPHFVTIGERHLSPDAPSIRAVHFTTHDVSSIFYDFDAFGHLIDSKSVVESIVKGSESGREIVFGESPEIFYFSGKYEIIEVETPIGLFRVSHRPNFSFGSSNREFIKSSMIVTLEYPEPIIFHTCIERVMSVHRFLSLLAGRKQSIESVFLDIVDDSSGKHLSLELYWMFAPKRSKNEDAGPRPGDIPLDAIHRPDEFKTVLKDWLSRDPEWGAARIRYAGCVGNSNSYDIDRLVAAANMFDILPQDAMPSTSPLSPELASAQKECREIFKKLARGVERDSILGALGRMNTPSLTTKVLYRVTTVNAKLNNQFPDLALVGSTAVKVRNFFVHGSSNGFDWKRLEPLMPFLTDALEFIFAASDLINAGWDASAWGDKYYSTGHTFTRFRWGYKDHVSRLKDALS